jgi:Leucine-rich repeat (LRR) protein
MPEPHPPAAADSEDSRAKPRWATSFICYPREEQPFVDDLKKRLLRVGVFARGDWEFVDGQDFRLQAERLIIECDFFLFIITPTSIASDECSHEIFNAIELGKRIFPIVRQDCSDSEYALLPEKVRVIDFAHLRDSQEIPLGTLKLVGALHTDLDLAQLHRRLSVRTDDWLAGAGSLASADELRVFRTFEAETSRRPDVLPRPKSQIDYIQKSDQYCRARSRRQTIAGLAIFGTIIALLLTGIVLWSRSRLGEVAKAISDAQGYVTNTPGGLRVYFDSGADPVRALPLLRRLSGVSELDLGETRTTDQALVSLRGLSGIRRLVLNDTSITDAGLEHISGMTDLIYLDLESTRITDAGLERITTLRRLTALDLSGTRITDEGLKAISGLPRLEELDISGTDVTSSGFAALTGMGALTTLRARSTAINSESLRTLQAITSLRVLALTSCPINDQGIRYLAALKSLREMVIENTAVSGAGFDVFPPDAQLTELWAKGSALDDNGLGEVKKLRQLRVLSIPVTKITDSGLKAIADMSLRELYVGGNNISDEGLAHLSNMKSLRTLYLPGNPITDAGLHHLYELSSLQELRLSETKITKKGIRALQAQLPKTQISADPP